MYVDYIQQVIACYFYFYMYYMLISIVVFMNNSMLMSLWNSCYCDYVVTAVIVIFVQGV